mmetsp:Transcript_6446/g.26250  ORF Transcript_6446/g.26250 Transcript_6446/m.26250 type:complete len:80 (-) Transcript_6446:3074-3313(-)
MQSLEQKTLLLNSISMTLKLGISQLHVCRSQVNIALMSAFYKIEMKMANIRLVKFWYPVQTSHCCEALEANFYENDHSL